jgi:hypothetical protein
MKPACDAAPHRQEWEGAGVRQQVKVWLAGAMTVALGMSFAPRPAAGSVEPVQMLIINEHSGLCAFTFSDGGVQWPCDFTFPWEMWNQGSGQYSLVNMDSNKCMTVQGGSIQASARVVEGPCNSSIANLWRVTQVRPSDYHFINVNSGMCLTVSGASLEPGHKLIQFPCNTTAPHNETWSQFPVLVD